MKIPFYKLLICMLCFVWAAPLASHAQQTGSFTVNITMASQPRVFSVYVPTNYDPANSYSLIVGLHGLGDNSNNYRNALITGLGLHTLLPNTIFVCPDGGSDPARDFYTPLGDEAIIDSAIAWATTNYNINPAEIVLQGFSLGGNSALKYGLEHHTQFLGLMLHTPAIQGTKQAVNAGAFTYDYTQASQLPIYITHGGTDVIYGPPIDSAFERLVQNNGRVKLLRIPTMGHTIPASSQMPDYLSWFTAAPPAGKDIDLVRLYAPDRSCDPVAPVSVLVRNQAADPISSIDFEYSVGTATQTYTWNGNLAPWQSTTIVLPPLTPPSGSQSLSVEAVAVNGSAGDINTANNELTATFEYADQPNALPLFEGFETSSFPPTGWIHETAGDEMNAWQWDNQVMLTGQGSMFAFNTILVFDNLGRQENLISPVFNLQSISNPQLSFDLCFNYNRYVPPIATDTFDFADTLEISISTDCGDTWQQIYRKGGADLATFAQPFINPQTVSAGWTNPGPSDWRKEQISLAGFASQPEAVLRFTYISGLGGSINIDNIRVDNSLGIKTQSLAGLSIYPNPANEQLIITATDQKLLGVSVTDLTGRPVLQQAPQDKNTRTMHINTASFAPGYYLVRITTDNGQRVEKILVQH